MHRRLTFDHRTSWTDLNGWAFKRSSLLIQMDTFYLSLCGVDQIRQSTPDRRKEI